MSRAPAVLLAPSHEYDCGFCSYREEAPPVAVPAGAIVQRFHPCPGQGWLKVPLRPAGIRCEVRPVERGDYVGRDLVQRGTDGQVPMAFVTVRDDGLDCAVLAPTATLDAGDL